MDVSNAWRHRTVGRFISVAVRSVGPSASCDRSPGQHASKHAAATGHPIIASFEPDEDWFFDYEKGRMIEGMELLSPHSHPEDQPVPGPAGIVPANWESLLPLACRRHRICNEHCIERSLNGHRTNRAEEL